MNFTIDNYRESADYIKEQLGGFTPETAVILGSGLGSVADLICGPVSIPYGRIPHFKNATAPGHAGNLVFGLLSGKKTVFMQGRMHYYEGCGYDEIVFPVRVLRLLGAKTLIVTNAAGAVNKDFRPGDLMLISDHIRFFGDSPLRGPNLSPLGPRFPDSSFLYTPALREMAKETAAELGIALKEGVYMYFPGPQYETPAEIRAAGILRADAVGMSTVPEVIAASHAGMDVLGISLISNMAAGILKKPLSEEEVLDAADTNREKFSKLVVSCLTKV